MRHLTIIFLGLILSSAVFAQPELVVTQAGKGEFIIDYANDDPNSDITALQFSMDIGKASESEIDLSNCAAGLPATHVGFCRYNPGFVKVVVYSNSNAELPTANIGSIVVRPDRTSTARSAVSARGTPGFIVQNAVFTRRDGSDTKGEILQARQKR